MKICCLASTLLFFLVVKSFCLTWSPPYFSICPLVVSSCNIYFQPELFEMESMKICFSNPTIATKIENPNFIFSFLLFYLWINMKYGPDSCPTSNAMNKTFLYLTVYLFFYEMFLCFNMFHLPHCFSFIYLACFLGVWSFNQKTYFHINIILIS